MRNVEQPSRKILWLVTPPMVLFTVFSWVMASEFTMRGIIMLAAHCDRGTLAHSQLKSHPASRILNFVGIYCIHA